MSDYFMHHRWSAEGIEKTKKEQEKTKTFLSKTFLSIRATRNLPFQAASEGSVFCMFEGIRMLKPSPAVDMIMPGIWEFQWSSFMSFCPCRKSGQQVNSVNLWVSQMWQVWRIVTWWTKRSWGGKSCGAFTCSLVLALNSASSSSSLSKERSHILVWKPTENEKIYATQRWERQIIEL